MARSSGRRFDDHRAAQGLAIAAAAAGTQLPADRGVTRSRNGDLAALGADGLHARSPVDIECTTVHACGATHKWLRPAVAQAAGRHAWRSLDHLVGAQQQRLRQHQAQCTGGLQVQRQLDSVNNYDCRAYSRS